MPPNYITAEYILLRKLADNGGTHAVYDKRNVFLVNNRALDAACGAGYVTVVHNVAVITMAGYNRLEELEG